MAEVARVELPPIQPTPGDLVMILKVGTKKLEEIRRERPANYEAVRITALAVKVAVDHWIELSDAQEPQGG